VHVSCVRVCIESLPDNLVTNDLTLSCLVQIEYYFSKENLMQDSFLVSKMDKEYYVELAVLADFHLLKVLTTDEKLIIEAIKGSKKVRPKSPALLRLRYLHFFVCC
jgi:la-related protein 1